MTEIVLGDLVKPIGLQGDLKLRVSPDFWDEALASRQLFLVRESHRQAIHVVRTRPLGKGMFRTTFEEIGDRNASEEAVGCQLIVQLPDEHIAAPPELRPFQVNGFRVQHKDGSPVGTVVDLLDLPAQRVFVVQGDDKQHMIPHVPAIVLDVDLETERIVIDPPEGLLEL